VKGKQLSRRRRASNQEITQEVKGSSPRAAKHSQDQIKSAIFNQQVDSFAHHTNQLPRHSFVHGWIRSISLRHSKKCFAKSSLF
jgi:hypothetical protein